MTFDVGFYDFFILCTGPGLEKWDKEQEMVFLNFL